MRITKLDGLRGFFCLLVVLFHYDQRELPDFLSKSFVFRESWMFVEFFFVLSGYVISYNYSTMKNTGELRTYLIKRFSRLYPLLFFSTVIYLFLEILMNTFFVRFLNTPESINSLLFKTLDTLSFMNSTPVFGSSLGMNYPSWSISSEMISYLMFGVLIVFFKKEKNHYHYLSLILLSTLILINKKLFLGVDISFVRGILSFSLGVLIHKFPLNKLNLPNYIDFIVPFLIIGTMLLLNRTTGFYREIHSVITLNIVFYFSIHILLKTKGIITMILDSSSVQYLGKVSYSIYLNHVLMLSIIPRGVFVILRIEKTTFNMICVLFLTLLTLIIYSNYTFHYIEKFGGKYLNRRLLKS